MNTRQLEELGQYISYAESAGGEKPTGGEVAGAALAELFKLDRGFQKLKGSMKSLMFEQISP